MKENSFQRMILPNFQNLKVPLEISSCGSSVFIATLQSHFLQSSMQIQLMTQWDKEGAFQTRIWAGKGQ